MHTRALRPRHGPTLLVRPLRDGDVDTVLAVFERLGDGSRRMRFNGAKPRLDERDLRLLSRVDADRHVLVAYVEGDPRPAAIARLVRDGETAEIAFEVADELQHHGIGSVLTAALLADARAAGIREVTALVAGENRAALALLRRILGALEVRFDGGELSVRASLA
jgi:L-amino acid N-acyltransferase YncA